MSREQTAATGGSRDPEVLAALREAFDPGHYLAANPDVAEAAMDPFRHYMQFGWREGRDPAPWFDTAHYLGAAGLALGEAIPLLHYLTVGRAAGLSPSPPPEPVAAVQWSAPAVSGVAVAAPAGPPEPEPEPEPEGILAVPVLARELGRAFDGVFYLARHPDVAAAGMDPLRHYLDFGWREGRDPAPWFSTRFYLEGQPDLAARGPDPLTHYLAVGRAEGRPPAPPAAPPEAPRGPAGAEDVAVVAAGLDAGHYLRRHPGLAAAGVLPAAHYLTEGAATGDDPAPGFSTSWYLRRHPDVARSGVNPFVHYLREGRAAGREARDPVPALSDGYDPLVSVIVPCRNQAAFLPRRLESIAAQTWRRREVIVLDDASEDGSPEVIRATLDRLGLEAQVIAGEPRSGRPLAQWRRGLGLARGELAWICEGDDLCEPDFLARLVPHLADPSVTMAFGRVQFADAEGAPVPGLDAFRERAEPGIWGAPLVRPAAAWFRGAWGAANVLANIGGAVFRPVDLPDADWALASSLPACGDWLMAMRLAGTGQIAHDPGAVAYLRRHGGNAAARAFDRDAYFRDLARLLEAIVEAWAPPAATRRAFLDGARAQWAQMGLEGDWGAVFDEARLLAERPAAAHALLGVADLGPGGGELAAVNLANACVAAGLRTSMLAAGLDGIGGDLHRRLDPRVPVYHARQVIDGRRGAFLAAAGVSVVHTQGEAVERLLLDHGPPLLEAPWVATLGDAGGGDSRSGGAWRGMPDAEAVRLVAAVDLWIHRTDRDLGPLAGRDVDPARIARLDEARPAGPPSDGDRPADVTRAALGLGEGDVVFSLVAQGVRRKGWRAAVEAFRRLEGPGRDDAGRPGARLLLVGRGPAADEARTRAEGLPGVTFLDEAPETDDAWGDLLRLSDALLLPTRFREEAYPPAIVRALCEGVPVIATGLGGIPAMLDGGEAGIAGVLLPDERDTGRFIDALAAAMERLRAAGTRRAAATAARAAGRRFDLDRVAGGYRAAFERLAAERVAARAAALAARG